MNSLAMSRSQYPKKQKKQKCMTSQARGENRHDTTENYKHTIVKQRMFYCLIKKEKNVNVTGILSLINIFTSCIFVI